MRQWPAGAKGFAASRVSYFTQCANIALYHPGSWALNDAIWAGWTPRRYRSFAGIRLRDIASARAWYEQLLGSQPAFLPNETEAVWAVGEDRWLYVLEDAPKAGSARDSS